MGTDREIPETAATTTSSTDHSAALSLLLLSLKTVSQRALIAISSMFTFAAVGSAWWLFDNDIPADPSTHQLIGLGLYGAFVLTVLWIKRKGA